MKKIFFIVFLLILVNSVFAQSSNYPCSVIELINLNNENISSTKNVSATNVTVSNVTVRKGGNLSCAASGKILLKEGFKIEPGGAFKASIQYMAPKRDDNITITPYLFTSEGSVNTGITQPAFSCYNADSWEISVQLAATGQQARYKSGNVTPLVSHEYVNVTDCFTNLAVGYYAITIIVRNQCGKTAIFQRVAYVQR